MNIRYDTVDGKVSIEGKSEKLFEETPDPTFLIDKDGTIKALNKAFEGEYGVNREDFVGKNLEELNFLPEDSLEKILRNFEKSMNGEDVQPYIITLSPEDGEKLYFEIRANILKRDGKIVREIATARDVTQREKTKKMFRRAKEKYEDLFRGANELVVTTDADGYIKRLNEKALEASGYSEDELVGESVLEIAHPEDRDKFVKFWKDILQEGEQEMLLRTKSKDGDTAWLKAGGRPITEDGEIVEIQYNAQNITERKKAEERQEFLHTLLRHDLRNKISIIEGYLELISDLDVSDEGYAFIENSQKAARESSKLIEKVSTLHEISEEEGIRKIDIDPIVDEVISEKEPAATAEGIELKHHRCEQKVKGGPLLKEVFSNLIENSIKHSNCSLIKISPEVTTNYCIVRVEDDGQGIPDEKKEKIFEKGYTKGKTAGSGLGMYLVKRALENYDGKIEVKDSETGGALFEVYLHKA